MTGCSRNQPELKENSRKMLIGQWEVVKETVTNGDGFDGVFTREGDNLWDKRLYEFSDNEMYRDIKAINTLYGDYHITDTIEYTLSFKDNGEWLLTVEDLFDKQISDFCGFSPITIHKLTKNAMEWEYESYGGDEGPVVYYQYLKRR